MNPFNSNSNIDTHLLYPFHSDSKFMISDPNPSKPSFFKPDFTPDFCNVNRNIHTLSLKLALSVLKMTDSEFRSLNINDFKRHLSTSNGEELLAYEILIYYKEEQTLSSDRRPFSDFYNNNSKK